MKQILVPLDFSDVAENAFVFALEVAATNDARLLLFHNFEVPVVESQFFPVNYMDIYSSLEMAEFEFFKEKIAELRQIAQRKKLAQVEMNHVLSDGDLLHNLKEVIHREKIDFVIMGTSGAHDWIENFMGTNAGNLIVDTTVPVLTVPAKASVKKIKTIGFTTRFREKDHAALEKVLEFAQTMHADVKCLYVKTKESDVTEKIIDYWKEKYQGKNVQFYVVYDDAIANAVSYFLVSEAIDALAMLTYKRGFFEKIFKSSMTQKMAQTLSIPVLALHE